MIRATSVYLPAEIGGAARNTALGYDGGMKYALLILATTALGAQGLKFDFVSDKSAPGFQKALPGAMYSDETGYGFEDAAKQPPFYFSIRVPEEGNYRVTVTLGDPDRKSTRLNSSHLGISYAVFCLKKKNDHKIKFSTPFLSVTLFFGDMTTTTQ